MQTAPLQPIANQPHASLVTLYDWPPERRSWFRSLWFQIRLRRFALACSAILILLGSGAVGVAKYADRDLELTADIAQARLTAGRMRGTTERQADQIGRLTTALAQAEADLQAERAGRLADKAAFLARNAVAAANSAGPPAAAAPKKSEKGSGAARRRQR